MPTAPLWTAAEVETLRELSALGLSERAIADRMGRTQRTCALGSYYPSYNESSMWSYVVLTLMTVVLTVGVTVMVVRRMLARWEDRQRALDRLRIHTR